MDLTRILSLAFACSLLMTFASPAFAAKRALTIDDLLAVKSVADPQLSPDGKLVVYVVSEIDREAGKSNSSLWLVPAAGGESKRLTTTPGANNHPRWSPDGKTIAFVSSRGGSSQIWLLPLDGGEPRQLSKLPIDVDGPIWSPQGDKIAFTAAVEPGKTPQETAAQDKEKEASKSKVRVFDHLMIRHWASWNEGKVSHLFVCDATTGEARDLTPKFAVNVPPGPFGGSNEYAWSPDGKELAFTAEPIKDMAWSTNSDIWTVSVKGGEPQNRTKDNPGADAQPSYAPNGLLAYVRQTCAGFEADQWVLTLQGPGLPRPIEVSRKLDRSVLSFAWSDYNRIKAVIDDNGTEPIIDLALDVIGEGDSLVVGVPSDFPRRVVDGANVGLSVASKTGAMVFVRSRADQPGEIHAADADGNMSRLTHHNDDLIAALDVAPAERFSFKGADGDEVSGWLVKPPGFDPKKKYPVVFLIHGGPQGAWHDEWHARWNYQMWAAPGYALVAVNPRGSTGFGQKFTDQISQDWTGKVYEDLMKGLDHALKSYAFLDGDKVAAAGGSYGGFMVNWIAGHTDRFKCLISHAGVFDLASKYGTTEELWFPEWEFGGTPWEKPEHYRDRSPSNFVQNFKTPTLVLHGALDFRVYDAQGIGMFTALQRRGVPSRLVLFPDEGHWILKPANRVVWWNEMLGWLKTYLK